MKKFIVTILALVYLTTTTGATLHMHYCMGKVFSVDLVKKDGCSKCGMQSNEGCCTDQSKVIKINDSHQATSNGIGFTSPFVLVKNKYLVFEPLFSDVASLSSTHNNSPPNSSGSSLCILNCVFRL